MHYRDQERFRVRGADIYLQRAAYAVVTPLGERVIVIRGEPGYRTCADKLWTDLRAEQTAAETAAALSASMFGWTCPGADPAGYDGEGRPYGRHNRKPTEQAVATSEIGRAHV